MITVTYLQRNYRLSVVQRRASFDAHLSLRRVIIYEHQLNYKPSQFDVRCTVVGPFLWQARRPGTRYQTTFEIRRVLLTVFVVT